MLDYFKRVVVVPALCMGLVFSPVAYAEEPAPQEAPEQASPSTFQLEMPEFSYSILRQGQRLTASKDTYLLTPESFARITTEYQFMQRRYELYLGERLEIAALNNRLQTDLLTSQNQFLNTELERTNRLLVELQESRRNDMTPLWVAVSFVAGCALTVGLVYALQPGME